MFWGKLLIISRIFVILVAFGILFYVAFKILMPFGGGFETSYDFCQDAEYFSHLGPWQRVSSPSSDDFGCFQKINDNLIYFNFVMPQFFRELEVTLVYQSPDQEEISFGPEIAAGEYKRENLVKTEIDGAAGLYFSKIKLDLRNSYTKNKTMRFVISAPSLRENSHTLKMYEIKFKLSKPTVDINRINPKLRSLFTKLYNRI